MLRCSGHELVNLITFKIFLMGKGLNELSSGALVMNGLIKGPLTFPGLQKIKRLILRCIGQEWVNLTTFDIFLVSKGSNELSSHVLAIDWLIK